MRPKHICCANLIVILFACIILMRADIVKADVYMDFSESLLSTASLLNANTSDSQDRHIILNGVPLTTRIYKVNIKHNRAIENVTNYFHKPKHYEKVTQDEISQILSEPTVVVTKEWSALYNINLDDAHARSDVNFITFAKKISHNESQIFELKFDNAEDMKDLLFKMQGDVTCNEVFSIQRIPNSRRKFCLTELTESKILFQIVIYEGKGNPVNRANHYQIELLNQDYRLDMIDTQSHDRAIIFASNEISRTTIFTYKMSNKVLDVVQFQF